MPVGFNSWFMKDTELYSCIPGSVKVHKRKQKSAPSGGLTYKNN